MKKLLYLCLIIIQSLKAFGQNDYYVIESQMKFGDKLVDAGAISNSSYCSIMKNGVTTRLSPSEVNEYGFKNGRVFLSKTIVTEKGSKKVFLERLSKGKINLYYFRDVSIKEYFIEKEDGVLIPIPKKTEGKINFNDIVSEYINDADFKQATRQLTYYKPGFTALIDQYNAGIIRKIPAIRYGISVGGIMTRPSYSLSAASASNPYSASQLEKDLMSADISWDKTILVGLTLDLPILKNKFTFHPELNLGNYEFYSLTETNAGRFVSFNIKTLSFNLPLLIRYNFGINRIKPFVNTGGALAFNSVQSTDYYVGTSIENMAKQNIINTAAVYPGFHVGFVAGGGFTHEFYNKISTDLELRYNRLFGLAENSPGSTGVILVMTISYK